MVVFNLLLVSFCVVVLRAIYPADFGIYRHADKRLGEFRAPFQCPLETCFYLSVVLGMGEKLFGLP